MRICTVGVFKHRKEKTMITGLVVLGALIVIAIPVTISHVKK